MNYLSRLLCLALLMFGGHLAAEPLRVGVSFAIPPYVISHEDRGIELDLMREAFAGSPHELQVVYLPLERTFRMLEEGKLDAIINVKPGMLESAYLSQPVITFHNRVFTLAPTAVHHEGFADTARQCLPACTTDPGNDLLRHRRPESPL
jgi:polar amino acid transport system substrate-binding protein